MMKEFVILVLTILLFQAISFDGNYSNLTTDDDIAPNIESSPSIKNLTPTMYINKQDVFDEVLEEISIPPPELSGIDEIGFLNGTTGNIATWSSDGTFPQNYTLFLNGYQIQEGVWNSSSETIQIELDSLGVGVYTYRMEVDGPDGTFVSPTVVYVFADGYQSHAPISILNDNDFIPLNLQGNGSVENPYIIAGLNITDDGVCIFIDDTSKHFIIFDCYINTPVGNGGYGIQLWRVDSGAIISCIFVSRTRAIEGWYSNSIKIRNCIILDTWDNCITIADVLEFEILNCSIEIVANTGIHIHDSANGVVDGCQFYGDGKYPMDINDCTDLNITNNIFGQKGFSLTGDSLHQFTSIHLEGNIVNGKSIGYFVNESDIALDGNIYGQYLLINCTQVTLNGGNFDYGYASVILAFCNDCTVDGISAYESSGNPVHLQGCTGCTVKNCDIDSPVNRGIKLDNCIQCVIYDNIIYRASEGIELYRCGECIVHGNIATWGSSGTGLSVTNLTLVYDNIFDYNYVGVEVRFSSNCSVFSNSLQHGRRHGLEIEDSNYCIFRNNTLKFSDDYGIYVWGTSSNNLFYLNFIGSSGIENALDNGTLNNWDNGTIGNWWRDYSGTGVYSISGAADSIDHYPAFLLYVHIPNIVTPLNFEYDVGTTGNHMIWNLTDYYSGVYYIFRNGSLVDSDTLTSRIYVSVDGLSIGYYEYTLVIAQPSYENVTDTVYVTVVFDTTYPTIDSPDDVSYTVGTTGNRISWTPTDLNPNYYEIYQDGVLIENGTWSPSWNSINVTVDGLAVGIYSYTLKVSDILWHNVTDTVQVSVLDESTTTTTTTTTTSTTSETTSTTDTDTGTDTNPEMSTITLVMVSIGSVIVVVSVVVFIIRSKAPGT